ncbi:MAG: YihY/virulence factor BrkB family protein [Lactobacillus sp.]|jgi:membrane protein|nr:YihY/virulence factor BrkB family protein [Lactobacillus sp.]MCH3989726.1 YihY/virulence factor BrkB family protein [Lactobacillus sp.]MCI1466885.1 YihY/virulence factor BrkB family protein [Lactobacillus sp.]MCI1481703.1 YihY/virulence factor BrkB family protein [Lactobacillus sp.]MCI1883218.1 YihY/virulence factor BrkB family protein [Lactobacillus sp.]
MKNMRQQVRCFIQQLSRVLGQGEILQSSVIIAYYVLFGLFPLIMVIGNVLPLFKIDTQPIADYLTLIFPQEVSNYVMPIVDTLLKTQSTGYMSIGLIAYLWSFSCLINAIRIGMNRLYGVHKVELRLPLANFLWTRGLTVITSALLIMIFMIVIVLFGFGDQAIRLLAPIFHFSLKGYFWIRRYRWPVVIAVLFLTALYLNWALPNISSRHRVLIPGTLTTVIGWLLLSTLFSIYLNNFSLTWENYGIIGTLIIFMLWLNLCAIILLFGTSCNAVLQQMRFGRVKYSVSALSDYLRTRKNERVKK